MLIGIAMLVLAMALFVIKDSFAKALLDEIDVVFILWLQFAFAAAVLIPVVLWRHGVAALAPRPLLGQLLRSAMAVGSLGFLYWALAYIPLANAEALANTAPIAGTAMAAMLLGERVGTSRWIAVAFGFCGVLVLLRPGFSGSLFGHLIGLAAGLTFAGYHIMNRLLAMRHPPLVSTLHVTWAGAVLLAPAAASAWRVPRAENMLPLAGFLLFALAGQFLLINAFRFASVATLAPYQYSLVGFSAVAGIFIFGEMLDGFSWMGIALIVGAGLFVLLTRPERTRDR